MKNYKDEIKKSKLYNEFKNSTNSVKLTNFPPWFDDFVLKIPSVGNNGDSIVDDIHIVEDACIVDDIHIVEDICVIEDACIVDDIHIVEDNTINEDSISITNENNETCIIDYNETCIIDENNGVIDNNGNDTCIIDENNGISIIDNNGTSILDNNGISIIDNNGASTINENNGAIDNNDTSIVDNNDTSIVDNNGTSILDNNGTSILDNKNTSSIVDNKNTSSIVDNKNTSSIVDNKGTSSIIDNSNPSYSKMNNDENYISFYSSETNRMDDIPDETQDEIDETLDKIDDIQDKIDETLDKIDDIPDDTNIKDYSIDSFSFPSDHSSSSSFSNIDIPTIENSDSLEFPEIPPIESINWVYLNPLFLYLLKNEEDSNLKEDPNIREDLNIREDSNLKDHFKMKKEPDQSIFFDLRYLYFLKKVCNLTKKECVLYGKEHNKLLIERSIKNKASMFDKNFNNNNNKNIKDNNTKNIKINNIIIKYLPSIKKITIPNYDKVSFEYSVYKFKDNLKMISSQTNIPLMDVILIYYLKYNNHPIEINGLLLDKLVDSEWSLNDRIIFEENFSKYGTNFNKFLINKNEDELRIYYRFYLKNYLPVNWNEEERVLFANLIQFYKKDWNSMANHFERKNSNELKVFYNSYFKKLDEEERMREMKLVEIEMPKIEKSKK